MVCDVQPLGFRSVVNLRGEVEDASFPVAIAKALDVELPLEPNRWNRGVARDAIWLGPNEWLIVGADGDAGSIEYAIRESQPHNQWLSVVDLSHNYTCLLLAGPQVRDLLAKGCPLDLHALGRGDCAQSILARTRMLLRVMDDAPTIEVWVRNSFAHYAACWLLDAATEFEADHP